MGLGNIYLPAPRRSGAAFLDDHILGQLLYCTLYKKMASPHTEESRAESSVVAALGDAELRRISLDAAKYVRQTESETWIDTSE